MTEATNLHTRITPEHPLDASRMTAAQLEAELEKGWADVKNGRTIPMEQAFAEVRKAFGV